VLSLAATLRNSTLLDFALPRDIRVRLLVSRRLADTMESSLPPELTEPILDELGGDLLSLRACALVHSSWTLASQAHIFHTVTVHREEQWDALVELLRASSHIRPLLRRLETCDELSVSSADIRCSSRAWSISRTAVLLWRT
jgi:hypothetical protein